jgi:ATP-dependent DNA helicase RecG
MNKAELIKKLEDIEWEDFEVKEAKSEIPKNAWTTVSAFSNTAGGWLVFGVSKKSKSYNILGISNPEKIEQDFTTVLRNGTKFNRKITIKSKKYNFNGKTVLAFNISQQSPREKPVYFNSPLLEPQAETKEQLKKKLNLFTEILPMEKKTKKFQNII